MDETSKIELRYTPKIEPRHDFENVPKIEKKEVPIKKEDSGPGDAVENYKYYNLYSFFGLHDPDPSTKSKVEFIHSFLYGEDGNTTDILWKLKKIGDNLGAPELGGSRLDQIYSYIRLLEDRDELDKRIAILER